MEKKITKREVLVAIMEGLTTGDFKGVTNDEMVAFCANEIDLLDKKAAKAKERQAEKKAAGDELKDAVKAALTENFETRDAIAVKVAETFGEEATVAKVGYRLTVLAKEGFAVSEDIKIPATETTKARVVKGYAIAQ